MKWYQGEDKPKSVTQVVIDINALQPLESDFETLLLAGKYNVIKERIWTAGYFRLDSKPGPFLIIKADGYLDQLKNQRLRLSHCFYKFKNGGLYVLFIDFPELRIPGNPYDPFVLFEMSRGIDEEDERQRIEDALSLSELRICFAEAHAEGIMHGMRGEFDVVVKLDEDCRTALRNEWNSMLEHHKKTSTSWSDFDIVTKQWMSENPVSRNPIIEAPKTKTNSTGLKRFFGL